MFLFTKSGFGFESCEGQVLFQQLVYKTRRVKTTPSSSPNHISQWCCRLGWKGERPTPTAVCQNGVTTPPRSQ